MRNPADIIMRPVVSEKSMDLASNGKYVFYVDKKATKIEIKFAIEEHFNVKVDKVHTMMVTGKVKRQGKTEGKRPDRKKAIVSLKSGTIQIFDGI
jgi:large subunit ribosomal protein L23